jgi:hypothetical protein
MRRVFCFQQEVDRNKGLAQVAFYDIRFYGFEELATSGSFNEINKSNEKTKAN